MSHCPTMTNRDQKVGVIWLEITDQHMFDLFALSSCCSTCSNQLLDQGGNNKVVLVRRCQTFKVKELCHAETYFTAVATATT